MHRSSSVVHLVINMNQFPRAFPGPKTSHSILPGALRPIMAEHSINLDYAISRQVANLAVDILLVTSNPCDADCDCDGTGCDVCNAGGQTHEHDVALPKSMPVFDSALEPQIASYILDWGFIVTKDVVTVGNNFCSIESFGLRVREDDERWYFS
ncbi:hypothetical protein IFR05_014863 [Cadophora sp. M221]|nr:hypothetical protein IFR05_014863 [Cadophora sp. M221]